LPSELAIENDVLLKTVMDEITPCIRSRQPVLISSHTSLGAPYLSCILHKRGISTPTTVWGTAAWGITALTARRVSGHEVRVNILCNAVEICTIPSTRSSSGLTLCTRLFGDCFRLCDGLLAVSLSILNPQHHLGIALANMSRMERGERWSQGLNVTPNVGRLLEALDRERLDIARAAGCETKTIYEHFSLSFQVPVASVSEMNREIYRKGNDVYGPDTADSRYVTEDAPYGLAMTVVLGRMAGRTATLHEAGLRILSAMYGRDFEKENDLLQALDLTGVGMDELNEAGQTGVLRPRPLPVE